MAMVANKCGMDLELWQEGDLVYFRAIVDVVLTKDKEQENPPEGTRAKGFPPGMHIVCLDDSAVARRSLSVVLSARIPGSVVEVFGQSTSEVDLFVQAVLCRCGTPMAALGGGGKALEGRFRSRSKRGHYSLRASRAPIHMLCDGTGRHGTKRSCDASVFCRCDIAILDQYLDYPGALTLGSDIAQQIMAQGYQGLLCIRSGNTSAADQATYFRSGAHCVVDKDVPLTEVIKMLSVEHDKFLQNKNVMVCESFSEPSSP